MNAKLKSSNPRIFANRQGLWLKVGDSKLQVGSHSTRQLRARYLPALRFEGPVSAHPRRKVSSDDFLVQDDLRRGDDTPNVTRRISE